jgi:hypothetical protein
MKMKKLFSNLILAMGWVYVNVQIYLGFATGELNGIGRSARLVSREEEPAWFFIVMGLTIVFSLMLLGLAIFSLHGYVDRKVRAYGGNYNANTFKSIIQGLRK